MGSENQTTTPWTLTKRNAKTCPHDRLVFGLTSLANTLTQEPQEARLNSKGALDRNLVHSKNSTGQKTGRWRQFGAQYVLGGGLAMAKWGLATPFFYHFSVHLSSVLGRTELCHEVWTPGPQKPQLISNENHHLALFE